MRISKRNNSLFLVRKVKGIIIFDDIIPSIYSPWRSIEYNEILQEFKNSKILTDLSSFNKLGDSQSFNDSYNGLVKYYPCFKNKIFRIRRLNFLSGNLVYTLFYKNILKYYKLFQKLEINYVFTLYPGGGFSLYDKEVKETLKIICIHKCFKSVIVNQHLTKNYLLENKICREDQIILIHGIPFNLKRYRFQLNFKKVYNDEIRILFMANKYSHNGEDKGFPLFIEVIKKIDLIYPLIRFDIIGNFGIEDLPDKSLIKKINFHGLLTEVELANVLNNTQVIISPNAPFILSKGAFDGFPLGTCLLAGYFKNAMVMTDYFNEGEKEGWVDGENFIKITPNVKNILNKIVLLVENRDLLKEVAFLGFKKIKEIYSFEKQISSRIQIFKNIINDTCN